MSEEEDKGMNQMANATTGALLEQPLEGIVDETLFGLEGTATVEQKTDRRLPIFYAKIDDNNPIEGIYTNQDSVYEKSTQLVLLTRMGEGASNPTKTWEKLLGEGYIRIVGGPGSGRICLDKIRKQNKNGQGLLTKFPAKFSVHLNNGGYLSGDNTQVSKQWLDVEFEGYITGGDITPDTWIEFRFELPEEDKAGTPNKLNAIKAMKKAYEIREVLQNGSGYNPKKA